jgi:AraC-like DNA-binding protein
MTELTPMTARTFSPDDPALPMHYPSFVFRELCKDGHDAQTLLHDTGLTEAHLKNPHFRCAFEPLRRLFLNTLELTGDPHLGITLALRFEPGYVGLPAYAAMNAPCFRDALDVLNRFFFLTFPAIEFTFPDTNAVKHDGEAAIRLRPNLPLGEIAYFACSSALVGCDGLCKSILRRDRVTVRAEATVPTPFEWSATGDRAGFPIRFEAVENRLFFPEALLDQPLPGADPINHARLIGLCEAFAAEMAYETTLVGAVTAFLEKDAGFDTPFSDVASAIGVSERGLRRHLERSGTSYRKLVNEIRERRAREMLGQGKRPIQAIAYDLGFQTPSNFARSFKRWTGVSPKAFRDGHSGRGNGGQT